MELFKLFGTIAIDNDGANREIAETAEAAEKSGSKISAAFKKVGEVAGKVGKTVATGLAVGGAAVGALAKQALDSYASYEQLVGGVETLFKDSAGKVQEYANNAYKTAGMSANAYMETVTSFSASLLQSLDGDTAKAAEVADRAITDMSDNANKMGTDISMIQNAYQGFAKQNYTMLDNLKLGYGGTKEEMKRLLEDAQKLSGQKFDLSSYADIVEAIHVVQEEMGITGTTAKEASSTIEGSLASTKAAWQNLLTGFADGSQDLNVLVTKLVDTAMVAVGNIMPRIQQILGGIVEFIRQIVPVIATELPALLNQMLPGLIEAATALMVGLVAALPQILQIFISQVPFIISQISGALASAFPALLATVKQLFQQIWDYISLELLNTGVSFETATAKIQAVFSKVWGACQQVWNSIGKPIFDMVRNTINTVASVFSAKMPEIKGFVSQCFADIAAFWNNNLLPCLTAIGEFINNVLAPAFDTAFNGFIKTAVDNAFNAIKSLWDGMLKPVLVGITDFLTGVFTGNWSMAFNGIAGIATGILSGIATAFNTTIERAKNIVSSGLEFIRGLFNFEWSLPKLKMPHFSISGKFSLDPPSVPSISVDWYAKAMQNPMLLTSPTIFGYDEASGKLQGGGEAGAEVVSGANTLMRMIGSVVETKTAAQNDRIIAQLADLTDAITGGNKDLLSALLAGQVIKINEREFGRTVREYA